MTTSAEFSVYLRDDATSEQRGVIEAADRSERRRRGREYVSKEQALVRFRREFAELASMAERLGDNPFPASLEVRLQRSGPTPTARGERCCAGWRRCRAWPTSATTAPGWRGSAQGSTRCAGSGWRWRC